MPAVAVIRAEAGQRGGQTFTLRADGTDDVGITNVALTSTGVFSSGTNVAAGGVIDLRLPASTTPGTVQFQAQTTDTLGVKSPVSILNVQVTDGTPPTLTILSPADNATVDLDQPLNIRVAFFDNSTNVQLSLELGGALTLTQRLGVVVAPNIPATNTFTVSLAGVPRTGVSIHATVRASDDATNRTSLDREFLLPDITAPRLVDVMPANGATRQSLWHPPTFLFSETVAADTVTSGRLVLTNDSGVGLPYSVSLSGDNLAAFVSPTNLPLLPGVTYTTRLLSGITDASGNALLDSTGSPIPPQGISFTFTTAKFLQIFPTNNTRVIAGQTLPVTVNFEPGLGAPFFRFGINNEPPVEVFVGANAVNATGLVTIPTNDTQVQISIQASEFSFSTPSYSLPFFDFAGPSARSR